MARAKGYDYTRHERLYCNSYKSHQAISVNVCSQEKDTRKQIVESSREKATCYKKINENDHARRNNINALDLTFSIHIKNKQEHARQI